MSLRKRMMQKPPGYVDPRIAFPELAGAKYQEALDEYEAERRKHERHGGLVGMVTDAILIVGLVVLLAVGWSSALALLNVVTSLPLIYVAIVRVPRDVRRWRKNAPLLVVRAPFPGASPGKGLGQG
jgi:hypothetical protein